MIFYRTAHAETLCGGALRVFQPAVVRDLGAAAAPLLLTADSFLKNPELHVLDREFERYLDAHANGTAFWETAERMGLRYLALETTPDGLKTLMATGVLPLADRAGQSRWFKLLTERQKSQILTPSPGQIILLFAPAVLAWPGFDFQRREIVRAGESPADLAELTRDLMSHQADEWKNYGFARSIQASVTVWDLRAVVAGPLRASLQLELYPMLDRKQVVDLFGDPWRAEAGAFHLERPLVRALPLNLLSVFALPNPPASADALMLDLNHRLRFENDEPGDLDNAAFWLPFARSKFLVTDEFGRSARGRLIRFNREPGARAAVTFVERNGRFYTFQVGRLRQLQMLDYVANAPAPERVTLGRWDLLNWSVENLGAQKRLLIIGPP